MLEAPFVIIGLGNPGPEYHKSRHNAGFCLLDAFAASFEQEESKRFKNYQWQKYRLKQQAFYLVKPLTYMNLSGTILSDLKRRLGFQPKNLLVVCDNLDLPLGQCRLKFGGGSAGQKGLTNIIEHLGTAQFARLYIGIGRPKVGDVPSYVLGRFPQDQEPTFLAVCLAMANRVAELTELSFAQLQTKIN